MCCNEVNFSHPMYSRRKIYRWNILTTTTAATATEDRISSLSDEIICHILSFIPTKQAVTTTVLSKRWSHLWLSVPLLNFTDTKLENRESVCRFLHFVNSVLVSRDNAGSLSINSFYFDVQHAARNHAVSLTSPKLTNWIDIVVKRRVKYLHLLLHLIHDLDSDDHDDYDYDDIDDRGYDFMPKWTSVIPKCPNVIFTCKTLIVLKLRWFRVKGFSFSSIEFGFPSLKTLHLRDIDFDRDQDFMLLLDGCPVLEDFKACCIYTCIEMKKKELYEEFQSLDLSKLIRADVTTWYCDFPVKALSNSEFLRIHLREAFTPYDFPIFHNLTRLVINYDWDLVVEVLDHCPKLQHLDLYQRMRNKCDAYIGEEEQEDWVEPEFSPQCLSLYLRTCTIRDFAFEGLQKRHLLLARFILQNARVLQDMRIWCDMEQPFVERMLSLCTRASATCQLLVF